jgi:hypothetical protein
MKTIQIRFDDIFQSNLQYDRADVQKLIAVKNCFIKYNWKMLLRKSRSVILLSFPKVSF